jgi:DNA-binding NarL/FixJ family response regulator
MPITIAMIEDDAGICEELTLLLAEAPDLACVCICRNVDSARRMVPQHSPDVILMDIGLPDGSGVELTAELKSRLPQSQIMVFTVYEDSGQIYQALAAGASGYLLKRTPPEEVIRAIREIRNGGAPMSSAVARKVIQAFRKDDRPALRTYRLTPREEEVLEMLERGLVTKEIADRMNISFQTVKTHLKHIYEKLHVRSRSEAVFKYRS